MNVPPAAQPDRPARLLLVEDDSSAAGVLRTLLERVGYEVHVAADGALALALLEAGPTPDLLLLDWMLPEVSGLEICRRVRERWSPLQLPILMVTAKTDAQSIAAAFAAGASDYLTKPFLGAELRARVASHLRIKQLLDERVRLEEHLREREKLSVLGLLVSGVAHDLNNPLAGISGYTQLLREEEDDPRKADALDRILAEVQRCNQIVGDLLAFARRRPVEYGPVQVEPLVRASLQLRERPLERVGVRTHCDVQPGLPPLWASRHQLEQVLLNILVNAEQAMRDSGGELHLRAALLPDADPEHHLQLDIHNDGPPIPEELLPRIFDPFFTTKGADEGTGLGLAISQRIVREHGGELSVESGAAGTTFRILLPLHPPDEAA